MHSKYEEWCEHGENRIKYELWRIKNPGETESFILALHHNILLQQTIERALSELQNNGYLRVIY